MPPTGFEPAFPVGDRPQTHALDLSATGIGQLYNLHIKLTRKCWWNRCTKSDVWCRQFQNDGQTLKNENYFYKSWTIRALENWIFIVNLMLLGTIIVIQIVDVVLRHND